MTPTPAAELRQVTEVTADWSGGSGSREAFVRPHQDRKVAGVVELNDTDSTGRARYLHDGRAAPRVG